ncbi:hypothetical protein [Actinokineospora sp. HUAS TT18]|uniref:hypothetical protein n=1 Tax=Actinokineospora sp. HUAS TT18 TaxID=3447451 RepID=UPI003F526361
MSRQCGNTAGWLITHGHLEAAAKFERMATDYGRAASKAAVRAGVEPSESTN